MRVDHGLFGPDSVSWRVIGHPSTLVGGLRALQIQALHPLAMAGVAQHSDYLEDPVTRLQRTARYVSTVTFGTTEEAEAAAAIVRRVHRYVHGTDPVTGKTYSASNPATMTWVHCVEVHSFLAAYRAYARPLSRADQDRYLAEQVEAAVLLGIPRGRVPDSVDSFRDYFASVQSELRTSEEALTAINFARRMHLPGLPLAQRLVMEPAFRVMGDAATSLVPRSLRQLGGLPGPGLLSLPNRLAVTTASNAVSVGLNLPVVGGVMAQVGDQTLGARPRPRVALAA